MKIAYFGDGLWAQRALDRILDAGRFQIVAIVARHSNPDPVLRDAANRLNVPFLSPPDVNDRAFIDRMAALGEALYVSMSYDQILRREILDSARLGFINCHAGALPFYRGRNPLNWVLINGEKRFGVTVHDVDLGIDTGDVIVQNFADIGPDDTYATLLERAHDLCGEVLLEALRRIADGTAKRTPQSTIHPVGFYCGRRRDGDEVLDWSWPTARLHNFIRGITLPGPCARTWRGEKPVAIVSAAPIPDAPSYIATPGEVVGRFDDGVVVKTGDTTIMITGSAAVGPDGEFGAVEVPRWPIGSRLGTRGAATSH